MPTDEPTDAELRADRHALVLAMAISGLVLTILILFW